MRRELALRLLQTTLPGAGEEAVAAQLFRELQFLADYKYNKYEMYHPGRLFLENLYLWLQQFDPSERDAALEFVRQQLIFVSRQEFQQLAGVLYHDVIRRCQLQVAAALGGHPSHKVSLIRQSRHFDRVARASLYVGMSDGARIDYIRRQNLAIGNEQVLPHYEASESKVLDVLRELRKSLGDSEAKFHCIFLLDDFCGSGRTLLREVATTTLPRAQAPGRITPEWQSRLRVLHDDDRLDLLYEGPLSSEQVESLKALGTSPDYHAAIDRLTSLLAARNTELKGALSKVATRSLADVLLPDASVYYCPLIATDHAVSRLEPLVSRLPGPFSSTRIHPGALIRTTCAIKSNATPIGGLCAKYYTDDLGDQHTGCVRFGFDGVGLPLVLHHNTPNNSIFLLWARRHESLHPLFVRYERHGREGA